MAEYLNLKIVLILAVGFALASLLGYLSQRIRLSPILGYLVAGFLVGPFSPGFVADPIVSEQLAEIGVVLMMFGVGLHFKWQDLAEVKGIATVGAIGQTLITAVLGTLLMVGHGWPVEAGIIFGLAIGVASTVVLVRVLTDNALLHTPEGHVAVGWLIVEDIITVFALLLVPPLARSLNGEEVSAAQITGTLIWTVIKFLILLVLTFSIGRVVIRYILTKIVETRSHELFTLTILALTFVIATASAMLFGASIALGAFIAGMVIGQTDVRHKVSTNATPIRDAFVVIFFLSVGMLFNPISLGSNFLIFILVLLIILILKPVTAFLIALVFRKPRRIAVTVALALAQIGEFSFILSEQAAKFNLLPEEGYNIIVACALISISLNPLLFKLTRASA